MPHTILYNPKYHMIEITIRGLLRLNDVKEVVSEAAQVINDQNCHLILNDMRKAMIKMSTMEIYELPGLIAEITLSAGIDVHQLKRAFLAENNINDYGFFETVTYNQAQNAKLFFKKSEARKWLSKK